MILTELPSQALLGVDVPILSELETSHWSKQWRLLMERRQDKQEREWWNRHHPLVQTREKGTIPGCILGEQDTTYHAKPQSGLLVRLAWCDVCNKRVVDGMGTYDAQYKQT